MKPAARSIATAAALAAFSILPAGGAQAHALHDERGVQLITRSTDQTPTQQTLQRTLTREHNAYPAPLDQQAQAAQQTLARTLAREYHTYPAPNDSRQPTNTGQADPRRTASTLTVIAITAVLAMTWRRRARSGSQEAA
jgi:hypothetical protein